GLPAAPSQYTCASAIRSTDRVVAAPAPWPYYDSLWVVHAQTYCRARTGAHVAYSRGLPERVSRTPFRNRFETAPVAFERDFLAGQPLPAFDDNVDVFRIEFQATTHTLCHFRRSQCRAATQKRLINQLAWPGVV